MEHRGVRSRDDAGRFFHLQSLNGASVEDVALLKSADRQKILVEGAKKEGKLSFYTTLIVEQVVRPLKDAFEKEYPFIQVEFFRRNSDRITQRLFAEYQAKRYAVDVVTAVRRRRWFSAPATCKNFSRRISPNIPRS